MIESKTLSSFSSKMDKLFDKILKKFVLINKKNRSCKHYNIISRKNLD